MGCFAIAGGGLFASISGIGMLLMAVFGLGLVIFVHELGHFLVAKACGVRCDKFYLGFDVPIGYGRFKLARLLRFKWGETEYGIGTIPFGGYVKMLGQDDNPENAKKENDQIRIKVEDEQGNIHYELDPRSYPAKKVWQRMLIISAGVTMNLIFAVIFATVAYAMGVSYTPCVVGGTTPGQPAWQAGIRPGEKILQMGRNDRRDEQLRFRKDLRVKILASGAGKDLDILLRDPDGRERWVTLKPSEGSEETANLPTIGILAENTLQLATMEPPAYPDTPAARATPALKSGDRIVAVDGLPVEVGGELNAWLAMHPDIPMTVRVNREIPPPAGSVVDSETPPRTETLEVTVQPESEKGIGAAMTLGPVQAVQADSPAEKAGIQPGDQILEIDGQPVTDPLALGDILRRKIGQEVTLLIRRATDSGEVELPVKVTPVPPDMIPQLGFFGSPTPALEIGLTAHVLSTVSHVDPQGPAAGKLRPGDRVVSAQVVVPPGAIEEAEKLEKENKEKPPADRQPVYLPKFLEKLEEPLLFYNPEKIAEKTMEASEVPYDFPAVENWPLFHQAIQNVPAGSKVRLTVVEPPKPGKKTGTVRTVELPIVDLPGRFDPERGFRFQPLEEVRTAQSAGEALYLGLRETWEGVGQVFIILRRITSTYKSLGGPGTIFAVAASEAGQGWARLFAFLCLLSANLAVINFLPIPVLDGGHMVFLAAEAIRGRPVDEELQMRLMFIGLFFILGLMAFVIYLDVIRFLPWFY